MRIKHSKSLHLADPLAPAFAELVVLGQKVVLEVRLLASPLHLTEVEPAHLLGHQLLRPLNALVANLFQAPPLLLLNWLGVLVHHEGLLTIVLLAVHGNLKG